MADNTDKKLDKLINSVDNLTRAVQKSNIDLQQAFSNKQQYTLADSSDVFSKPIKELEHKIVEALKVNTDNVYKKATKGHAKGDLKESLTKKLHNTLMQTSDEFAEILQKADSIGVQFADTLEGLKYIHKLVESIQGVNVSNDAVYDAIGPHIRNIEDYLVNLSKTVEFWKDSQGQDVLVRVDSVFSQAAEDVRKLNRAVGTSEDKLDKLNEVVDKINTTIDNLAKSSQMTQDVLDSLNNSIPDIEDKLKNFGNVVSTGTSSLSINISKADTQMQSLSKALGNHNSILQQVTNAQISMLKKIQNANSSGSSGESSFRQQAVRNSDRAKQAGFIALLIPALAKLLRKTPLTDLLRYAALRLGNVFTGGKGGGVGGGIGAAAYLAAPLAVGGLTSLLTQKAVWKALGIASNNVARGTSAVASRTGRILDMGLNPLKVPLNKQRDFFSGILDAIRAPKDINALGAYKVQKGYNGFTRTWNNHAMTWQTTHTGPIVSPERLKAFNSTRVASRYLKGVGASTMKSVTGSIVKRAPIIGSLLGVAMEIPELFNAAKSGRKGAFTNQLGKSAGGVAGGVAGAALGSMVLPGIGTIIGGILGDIIGRHVGPAFMKGFAIFNKNIGKDFRGIWKGISDIFKGLGKVIVPIANLIGKVLSPVFWLLGAAIGGVVKTVAWGVNMFSRAVGAVTDLIGSIVTALTDGFEALLNKIKGWFNIGDDGTIGGVGASSNPLTPQANKLEADKKTFERVKAYQNGDHSITNKLAYDALLNRFREEYVKNNPDKSNKNYSDLFSSSGNMLSWFQYKKLHPEAKLNEWEDRVDKYNDSFKKGSESKKSADEYANKKLQDYLKNEEHRLNTESAKLSNASEAIKFSGGSKGIGTFYGHNVTSGYGWREHPVLGGRRFHEGIDLDFKTGEKVGAYTGGKIAKIGSEKGYGNVVIVEEDRDGQKIYHRYAHLQGANKSLKVGQQVGVGALLGYAGSTGYATGPHLHYEQRLASMFGKSVDPRISATSNLQEYQKQLASETATAVAAKTGAEESASSGLREGLAKLVGAKDKSDKQERTRNIVLSATDVTGSLGVWGITQLNNGVMRTGR